MKKPMLGVMIDCSRDAVPSVAFLEKYASLLASFGYNALMLYTEDTYEVEGEPLFGSMRGRYSIRELQQLDAFLKEKGIELIPCVQTLAHLGHLFKYPEYAPVRDTDDVLLCGEEKTYRLIESVFSSLRKAFSTDRVHIGMDEAYRVGLGKYLEKHGYEERFSVINRHLHRVCALAEKYGFRPMIWSDMFCKLASGMAGDGDFYRADPEEVKKTLEKASLPENVTLVYWDYYSLDKERYSRNVKVNRVFGRPVVFAGGAWTWRGYAPDNTFSFEATKAALSACRENGVEDVFFTSWGDGGSECPKEAVLPALAFGAAAARSEVEPQKLRDGFLRSAGIAFDDLVLLDALDCPPETPLEKRHSLPPARTLLFNDPFLGESDDRVGSGSNARYAALEKNTPREKAGRTGRYSATPPLCAPC